MSFTTGLFLLALSVSLSFTQSTSPRISSYLIPHEKKSLGNFFKGHINDDLKDSSKLYNVLLGLNTLKEPVKDLEKFLESVPKTMDTADKAFYRVSICKLMGSPNCKWSKQDIETLGKTLLVDDISAENLYYIVSAMKDTGIKIDSEKIIKLVNKLKASGADPANMAFIFLTLAKLGLDKAALRPYLPLIGEILDQADSLDDSQLFFDRGLYTTAMLTRGISELIATYGESWSGIPEQKLVKLINFVRVRCHSSNLRAAAHMVAALKAISINPVLNPLVMTVADSTAPVIDTWTLHRTGSPFVRLRLTSVWDREMLLKSDSVVIEAGGLHALGSGLLVGPAEHGEFTPANDILQLSLASSNGSLPPPGLYGLTVSVKWSKPNDTRLLLGATNVQLPIRVVTDVKVNEAVLVISDETDGHMVTQIKLRPEQTHTDSTIHVESGQRLVMRTQLLQQQQQAELPYQPHQVFAQLTHHVTQQMITFVCQAVQGGKQYELKLSVDQSAADFDHLSGLYKLELAVGDPFIVNSILWHVADVQLTFAGSESVSASKRISESMQRVASAAGSKRANSILGPGPNRALPAIEHVFRQPERRAPRLLSTLFTCACAVPLLGLFVSWLCIGVNVDNFRFTVSGLVFHAGLIAIFTLYYVYWLRLNMFTTLGYLGVLAVPTFLAGVGVLRQQLHLRQQQQQTTTSRKL